MAAAPLDLDEEPLSTRSGPRPPSATCSGYGQGRSGGARRGSQPPRGGLFWLASRPPRVEKGEFVHRTR